MAGQPPSTITIFVKADDPSCAAAIRYLDERGHSYTTRDVTNDPSASAVLFGRLGRVTVPAIQVGERLIVGFDPVQLARFLPRLGEDEPAVSFGAAVRAVSPDLAGARGLPATYGVEVGRVTPGSAADAAGLQPQDVITAIGAYTLTGGADQFVLAVNARRPGDRMAITVWRNREAIELVVTFAAVETGVGQG